MATKKKIRKFADGGFTAEQEEWLGGADRTDPYILARMRSAVPDSKEEYLTETGKNPNISDDTRSRAMKFAEEGEESPVTKAATKSSKVATSKATPTQKPTPETPEEYKARMQGLEKKQALINVSPEDYVTPGGILKGMFKKIAGKGLKSYTAKEIADMSPKMIGREPLKLGREPLKLGMKKGGSVKKMSSGGKVSSASKRADGCAIRGKTRA